MAKFGWCLVGAHGVVLDEDPEPGWCPGTAGKSVCSCECHSGVEMDHRVSDADGGPTIVDDDDEVEPTFI